MATETEQLKESLTQTKIGAEALAVAVAQVLCERDSSFRVLLGETLDDVHELLTERGDHEAAEMIGSFGRALIDPAFKIPSR